MPSLTEKAQPTSAQNSPSQSRLTQMLDTGFRRVYGRITHGCGQTCYPSRITNASQ